MMNGNRLWHDREALAADFRGMTSRRIIAKKANVFDNHSRQGKHC
jgi:hypothetical protein